VHFGVLSLLPPLLTLVLALSIKNIYFALFCGIVSCSIIVSGVGFFPPILETYVLEGVKGNLDMFIYLITFGIFLATIKRSGGFAAFAQFAEKKLDNGKKAKLLTWFLSGIVVNSAVGTIGVGSIMRPITDRYKIPREKLGFILSTTAENVSAIVPITIYVLFFGGLIQSIDPNLNGSAEFVKSIPFNFFSILCIILALLYALEVLPDFGYMKKCETRARETGQLFREGSEPMETKELDEMKAPEGIKPDFLCFLLPFISFFIAILFLYLQRGSFVLITPLLLGLLVSFIYSLSRGYYRFSELTPLLINGAKSMVGVAVLLTLAFGFGKAVGAVGFANFVVEATKPLLTPKILPAAVFLICCVGSYATGSLVSACVILAPIAISLSASMGANLTLVIAALVGGSTYGDSTSPLSDIVVESAMGASVDVVDLGKAQFSYKLIVVALTTVLYLILGSVM
jgi:Na+/H+ antiporter NhaC